MEEAAKTDVKKEDLSGIDYLAEGKKIAAEAQGVLGKNLMNAINTGGSKYAVDFCNIEAIPLTDSMANCVTCQFKKGFR